MEKQQSQCRTALIKAMDNLQSGTRQERDGTSQGSSLAQILIKPQFNAGWGFVGRNVILSEYAGGTAIPLGSLLLVPVMLQ